MPHLQTMRTLKVLISSIALLSAVSFEAQATDGYFAHGYGMKSKGMGGVSAALAQDAFGGANNPSSLVWAGDRLELGLDYFQPDRQATFSPAPGFDIKSESKSSSFLIPEIAYSKAISDDLAWGVTIYGNGGMNTDYRAVENLLGPNVNNILGGSTDLGVDLTQLLIAPTISKAINADHAVGISLLIAGQRFQVKGLQAFAGFSSDPSRLTNNGYDTSYGIGVRLGYIRHINDQVDFGASYAPKINMSEFDDYAGLFAEQGDFDIPSHYSLGFAYRPNNQLLVAVDFERINYSDANSVGFPSSVPGPLGADVAPGFGWNDVSVWKLGTQYQINDQLTLRAGYNHTENPIEPADVTFNILAPGVVESHFTLGLSYKTESGNEWTLAYMNALNNEVRGARPAVFGGGEDRISMSQDSFGVQYSFGF